MKNMYLCLSISFLILIIILTISNSKYIINIVENFDTNCETIDELEKQLSNDNDIGSLRFKKDTSSIMCNEPCEPGTYIDKNTGKCEECDVSSYSDDRNLFECKSCPENTLSFLKGAKTEDQCKDINDVFNLEGIDEPENKVNKLNDIIKHLREKVNEHKNKYDLYDKINKGYTNVEERYKYINETNTKIKNLKEEIDILLNTIY